MQYDTPQSVVWSKIKILKSGYTANTRSYPILNNNQPVTNNSEKANIFANYFNNKYDSNKDDTIFTKEINVNITENKNNEMSKMITMDEMENNRHKLKNNSPGPDDVLNSLIKSMHPSYKDELLAIYNQSFTTGSIPKIWKHGFAIPIPKPGKPKTECSSYCPITLLSCIGKLLERIIQKRIEYFVESKNLLSKSQTGFRPGQGTQDVLRRLTDKIETNNKGNNTCGVVHIDLEVAFDSI